MSHTFPRENRIKYVKAATGWTNLSGLDILDLGGNSGNLLRDGLERSEISEHNYVCVDVDTKVMENCALEFPSATWITRQHYNPVYSPDVSQNVLPDLSGRDFDLIFAYSVYTHDSVETLFADLDFFQNHLRPGGTMLFTIVTPDTVQWFTDKRRAEYGESVDPESFDNVTDVVYYVDNLTVTPDISKIKSCDYLVTVYNKTWLLNRIRERFSDVQFVASQKAYQAGIVMHK